MIGLFISVCMIEVPTHCKVVKEVYDVSYVTPQQCQTQGQFAMAVWIEDHPSWTIKRWHCGDADEDTKNANL